MSQYSKPKNRKLTQTCAILLGITIAVWLLRGFGIFTFIPSGIIGLLFLLSVATGIMSRLQSQWGRF